jgi:hypothetical protein
MQPALNKAIATLCTSYEIKLAATFQGLLYLNWYKDRLDLVCTTQHSQTIILLLPVKMHIG